MTAAEESRRQGDALCGVNAGVQNEYRLSPCTPDVDSPANLNDTPVKSWGGCRFGFDFTTTSKQNPCRIHTALTARVTSTIIAAVDATIYARYLPLLRKLERD